MRFLHVSDLHATRRWFNWVLDHADRFDGIVYTGDFLDACESESLGVQVRWITAWARLLPRPFIWCPGNHDVESKAHPVVRGKWLSSLPGAKAFSESGHLEWLGHTFVRVNWQAQVPSLRRDDIILSHNAPAGRFTSIAKGADWDKGNVELCDALWRSHSTQELRRAQRCQITSLLIPRLGRRGGL
jgi:predicted MPP superfamily phosphohydrolase